MVIIAWWKCCSGGAEVASRGIWWIRVVAGNNFPGGVCPNGLNRDKGTLVSKEASARARQEV